MRCPVVTSTAPGWDEPHHPFVTLSIPRSSSYYAPVFHLFIYSKTGPSSGETFVGIFQDCIVGTFKETCL